MENDFVNKDEDGIKYSFNIKYNGTLANKDVHKRFKQFCKEEADDVYIIGLKTLMDYYDERWMVDQIAMRISILEQEIEALKLKQPTTEEKKQKVPKAFGED